MVSTTHGSYISVQFGRKLLYHLHGISTMNNLLTDTETHQQEFHSVHDFWFWITFWNN